VPVNALLFRSEGLRAVVIDASHHVRLQALAIGRDYGNTLEVLNGLKADDWIVLNPPDSIENGQEVHVKELSDAVVPAPAAGRPGNPATYSAKPSPPTEKKP